MNTITHVLVNATIDRRVRERRAATGTEGLQDRERAPSPADHPIATSAFLWGGAVPDLPLIVMTVGTATWFTLVRDWSLRVSLEHVFDDLYFTDPWWKLANNLLQSPVMLLLWFGVAVLLRRRSPELGRRALWFLAGVALHVAVDIPVHHDDGPLVLFPFDWETRIQSPISYWDPEHYGGVVGAIEYAAMLGMTLYLLRYHVRGWWRRLRARFSS